MKIRYLAAMAATIALSSSIASAAEREEINPWVDCGIGAMIFPDENLEIGAGISNVTWDLGTTAVSSATSSPESCKGTDNVKSAMFIQQTYGQLAMDIARGNGEYVSALASLQGCSDTSDAFTQRLRVAFGGIVSEAEYANLGRADRAQRVYQAARSAAAACDLGA